MNSTAKLLEKIFPCAWAGAIGSLAGCGFAIGLAVLFEVRGSMFVDVAAGGFIAGIFLGLIFGHFLRFLHIRSPLNTAAEAAANFTALTKVAQHARQLFPYAYAVALGSMSGVVIGSAVFFIFAGPAYLDVLCGGAFVSGGLAGALVVWIFPDLKNTLNAPPAEAESDIASSAQGSMYSSY